MRILARRLMLVTPLLAGLARCHPNPLGRACVADAECGSGFDCLRQRCVQLCSTAAECPAPQRCERYHCVGQGAPEPAGALPNAAAQSAPGIRVDEVPAVPDATVIELRAIRRELELVRQNQEQMLQLLRQAAPGAKKP